MMPFPGGIESLQNGTLVLSFALSLLYLLLAGRPVSWRRTVAKAGSIALLAVLAFNGGAPLPLVAGLALCALGDAALAQEGEKAFLAGLGAFLLAHLAYAAVFFHVGEGAGALVAISHLAPALVGLAVVALLLAWLWGPVGPALRLPIAAYALAIALMTLAALTVPSPAVIAGAFLFLASDALLAWQRFLAGPRQLAPLVWISYYAAQLAIVLGFLLS